MSRDVYAKPPASKAAKQPIGVGGFSGPQAPKVRSRVLKVLRDSGSYEVTDVEDVKPGASAATYKQMAQGIQAEAIVVGTVSNAANLTLGVYGSNGTRIEAIQVKGGTFPKLFKAIDNEVEIAIADPLERAHGGKPAAAAAAAAPAAADDDEEEPVAKAAPAAAAAKAAPSDEEEAIDEAPSEGDDAGSSDAPSEPPPEPEKGLRPLELSVGLRGYNRSFKYTGQTWWDPNASPPRTLYPYNLALAPTLWLAGRFYPGALFGNGPLSNLGLMFRYEFGFATTANYQSTPPPGAPPNSAVVTPLKTKASEYQLGLRGRLPIGPHELGIFGLYGNHSFVLAGDEDPTKGTTAPYAVVPDVHYHYLRFGLDARFQFSKVMIGAHFAPRFLTAMPEIDKRGVWFPGATGSGLDFGATAGFQLLPWLMPAVGVDMVRYGFDFNNTPVTAQQMVVAGGATDTYLSGWIGATATFDFAGGGPSDGGASVEVTPSEPEEKAEEPEEPEEPTAKAQPKAAAKPKAKPQVEEEEADEDEPPPPKPKAKAKKPVESDEEEEDAID